MNKSALLIICASLGLAEANAATTVTETFSNGTGVDAALGTVAGWRFYYGNAATAGPAGPTAATRVSSGAGSDSTTGFLFDPVDQLGRSLTFTTTIPTGITVGDLTQVSFWTRNASLTQAISFAILVNDQWYRSAITFTSASTTAWGQHTISNFSGPTDWIAVTLNPGVVLNGSGTTGTALNQGGTVQGWGYYMDQAAGTNSVRFDTLSVTYVPEPSAILLSGLGVMSLLHRRRRS